MKVKTFTGDGVTKYQMSDKKTGIVLGLEITRVLKRGINYAGSLYIALSLSHTPKYKIKRTHLDTDNDEQDEHKPMMANAEYVIGEKGADGSSKD